MEQTFAGLQLNSSLVEALKLAEITVPTEIQQKVIPAAGNNSDLIFQSETGTGKTLAYLLPLFEKLDTEKREMQALILVPTHELAIQVIRVIEMLSLNSDLKATSTPVIGDVNITRQVDKLRTKPHIIVGTAGRILELIQKKKISAHTIKTIIVDEADRLLDDSNIEGIKAVIKTTLKERQIVMCSASMSARTIERAKTLMKEPRIIKSTTAIEVPDTIDHIYFVAEQRDKIEVLRKLVRIINPKKAIAFFGNADDIMEATEKLRFHKLRADGLHGSNVKSDRKKTMDDFKSGRLQLLIASDIAARGLDIEGVTHIINVNIPERSMEYLHRAGRTGRNGNEGMAISIVTENEIPLIKQYEKELRVSIIPKSMYNGVIVEYRKEKMKFDTISEYGQRINKRKDEISEDSVEKESTATKSDYKRADRAEFKPGKGKDKPAYKRQNDDRTVKRSDKDSRPDRKYKPHDKDKTESKYKKDDKKDSRFKRDGEKTYSRSNGDDRSGSGFGKDGGNPVSRFGREEKGEKRYSKDGKRTDKKYGGDRTDKKYGGDRTDKKYGGDRTDKKFGGDRADKKFGGDRADKKFGGDRADKKYSGDKPGKRFSSDNAGKKFGRNEKPEKNFSRDDKKEGGYSKDKKHSKIKFVGNPPKNQKPWERKPQSGQKKGK